jgi:hypothetical protein
MDSVRGQRLGRDAEWTSCLWYRATFSDHLAATGQISTIREQFAEALGAAGWPAGACLFLVTRHARRGKTRHDEEAEAIFFSPSAIAAVPHLIAVCGAEPGPPPDRSCATLLVGNESDWTLLPRPTH